MDLQLQGKNALVTGGSRGIGRAICLALAEEGVAVATCARGEDGVRDVAAAIEAKGVRGFGSALDVRDEARFADWVAQSAATLGGIDIVVSNVSTRLDPASTTWWQDSFEADLMQHVRLKTLAVPLLRKGGTLIVVASVAASLAQLPPYEEAYGAMKAGVVNLVGQWAQVLGPEGVRVNAVSPGPIDFEGGWWDKVKRANPEGYERAARLAALGRLGTPEEVAGAVTFLASPRAAFVTGANLRIDGGLMKSANF